MKSDSKTRMTAFLLSLIVLVGSTIIPVHAVDSASESMIDANAQDDQEIGEGLIADSPEGVIEPNSIQADSDVRENGSANVLASSANLSNGVYAIMSYQTMYQWMTIANDSPHAGANLSKTYTTTYPTDSFDRSSLFKISRVGTTDRYIIRSMLNNCMSIDLTSDGRVITKRIPASDSSVSISDTFYIETNSSGYYIRPYGYAYVINMSSTDVNLTTVPKDEATISAKWTFIKYEDAHKSGMTLYRPPAWGSEGVVVGSTSQATLIGWSTYINANTLTMDVQSGYEDLGTLSWNSSTNVMTLTAENPGRIRINGRVTYASGSSVYSGYFYYMIVPLEGTYNILNAGTEKYIDVESASTAVGGIIQQWQYHTGTQAKFVIEHVEDSGGYVRVKSVRSNLYMGVDSSNTSLIKQYSALNDYTLWKIDRTAYGNLIFICKATESSGKVLSVPSMTSGNGADLTQLTHTEDASWNDEWLLVTKVISCVNYFDSTVAGDTQMLQTITSANSFTNILYAKYYGIGIYKDGASTQYATISDTCTAGVNEDCEGCGTDCFTSHHKNTQRMSDQLYNSPREDSHVYILWGNRAKGTYCREIDDEHTTITSIASVYSNKPVIVFYRTSGQSHQIESCMSITLAHEMAHVFHKREAYNDEGHDVSDATVCVMEKVDGATAIEFCQDVLNGFQDPFCSSCHEEMEEHTSNINILGNQGG